MSVSEKVIKTGLVREEGWLYFVDKKGNVARTKLLRGFGVPTRTTPEVLLSSKVTREPGWLYYVDQDGDIARAPVLGTQEEIADEMADDTTGSREKATAQTRADSKKSPIVKKSKSTSKVAPRKLKPKKKPALLTHARLESRMKRAKKQTRSAKSKS